MGLGMSNATHARSRSGSDQIINHVKADIDNIIKVLDGPEYDELLKQVKNNWSGAACDAFIEDLESKKKNLKTNINGFKTKIETIVNEDYRTFRNAQKDMYTK